MAQNTEKQTREGEIWSSISIQMVFIIDSS